MSEIPSEISESLSDEDIKSSLITAYEASDLVEQVMTADVPVMSPVTSRYRNMLRNAEIRYTEAVSTLSTSTELLEISESIHSDRCGCTPNEQKDGCDWHVVGKASSERARLVLQAGELKLNGFAAQDVLDHNPEMDGFLDYLDSSKADRTAQSQ